MGEPWIVAMPTQHPLAGRESVSLEDIRREPLVRPDIGPLDGPRPVWLAGPFPDGFEPRIGGPAHLGRVPETELERVLGHTTRQEARQSPNTAFP